MCHTYAASPFGAVVIVSPVLVGTCRSDGGNDPPAYPLFNLSPGLFFFVPTLRVFLLGPNEIRSRLRHLVRPVPLLFLHFS